tara:strand:- start:738 stop:1109 length:372 start_codon:yes stop_codon:yes gene_type:complete
MSALGILAISYWEDGCLLPRKDNLDLSHSLIKWGLVRRRKVVDDGEIIEAGKMLIYKREDECTLDLKAHTQLLLFGGERFSEERFLMWNFVSHSKGRLEQAKQEWRSNKFPKVPGDKTYIQFP